MGRTLAILLGVLVVSGCAPSKRGTAADGSTIAVQPEPPPGVGRLCWEEPKVYRERNGPGLNEEGTWYHPAHTAIREVKLGYWYDCETGKRVAGK